MNVRQKLALNANSLFFICFATLASFLTYTSMYAVRKAFTAGTFAGQELWGVDYKIWLVTAQTIGYTISKWIGIKVVAENTNRQRPVYIIALVTASVLSLLLFAVVPAPYNIICLFANGLPIGMIFGLVFNYLEGRRSTEILVVGLTITQIFSSGFVKSTGQYFIHHWGITDRWMPFLVGLCFLPLLLISVWMLEQLPRQSAKDIEMKSERGPMNKRERRAFVRSFLSGLSIFMFSYILMTAYRDYRDNFAAEIWNGLGFRGQSSLYTLTEIPVSVIILFLMIFLQRIRNNMNAFLLIHFMGIAGALLLLLCTAFYAAGWISPLTWISCTGVGLYIAYVPANTIFFERMIAVFKYPGNAGFVVIMADFYGYCGSLGVLFYKNFSNHNMSYSGFFLSASVTVGILLFLAQTGSCIYFIRKNKKQQSSSAVNRPVDNIALQEV
jgi:MFS family permease